ncbi:hypothetical protein SOVF_204740 [Spinacia oleracea]|nr:hypothetical protein SOVF_204740 [Spinacia oleracea]
MGRPRKQTRSNNSGKKKVTQPVVARPNTRAASMKESSPSH